MKVLVTGGCGFIGSHITDKLIERGHDVVVIDNLSTGKLDNLNSKAKLIEMDIRDANLCDVIAQYKPEVCYHEAAQIDIQKSIKDPNFDESVNIGGTINLLNACVKNGVKKFIYASSAAVYGNPKYLGIDEAHPINPISFYGISKFTPEYYIKTFAALYNIKYTIFRYANVYGIRQDPKGEGGVVSIFTDKLNKGETPLIFGDGEQTRDFIYVKDIAEANIRALDKADNEIINLGTASPVTVNRLIGLMAEIKGVNTAPRHEKERPGDIVHSYFNIDKMKEKLLFEPEYDLRRGLTETLEYYRQ